MDIKVGWTVYRRFEIFWINLKNVVLFNPEIEVINGISNAWLTFRYFPHL